MVQGEAARNLHRNLGQIKDLGKKPERCSTPALARTPWDTAWSFCDLVLIIEP